MKKIYLPLFLLLFISSMSYSTNHLINVEDFEFNPTTLTVNVGDTITWQYDHGFHTTTSTNIPASAPPWNNPIDQTNFIFSYVVTVPGSYDYQCNFHYSMGMVGHFTALGTTSISTVNNFNSAQILGNVIHESLNLEFGAPGNWSIDLLNLTGKIVKHYDYNGETSGKGNFLVSELPQGVYIVHLNNGITEIAKRIIKD